MRRHHRPLFFCATFALAALPLATASHDAVIGMTADDAFGQSSLNSGQGWADATAPSAGNGYTNANYLLRTPADANSYTFGGDSLTITSDQPFGAQLNDSLIYKGTGSSTLTINNFTVDGGALRHGNNENQTFTLAGNALTVGPNGMIVHIQGPLIVTSPVLGSGVIRVVDNGSNDARRTLEFTSPASTYNGSIELPTANRSRFRLASTGLLTFVIGPSGTNNSITGAGVVEEHHRAHVERTDVGMQPARCLQVDLVGRRAGASRERRGELTLRRCEGVHRAVVVRILVCREEPRASVDVGRADRAHDGGVAALGDVRHRHQERCRGWVVGAHRSRIVPDRGRA